MATIVAPPDDPVAGVCAPEFGPEVVLEFVPELRRRPYRNRLALVVIGVDGSRNS
jgi:hypothetical protein